MPRKSTKTTTPKETRTKEEFYSIFNFVAKTMDKYSVFEEYDFDYLCLKNFEKIFYEFLKDKHYITSEQRALIQSKLKENDIDYVEDFICFMVKEYDHDYDDFATLNIDEFYRILAEFCEIHQHFAESLIEDIKKDDYVNWYYLLPLAPIISYEAPPIQNTECIIDLKDLEYLKEAVENLENLISEEDKIIHEILKTMKEKLEKIN